MLILIIRSQCIIRCYLLWIILSDFCRKRFVATLHRRAQGEHPGGKKSIMMFAGAIRRDCVGIGFVSFSAFRLSISGCRFLVFRPMCAGKDATEEFDMLHDRKVIKKYGIDEGTVVLKGTLSKWMWRMRPAMVATFAMRPYGHFSAFSNWSSSSKPSWGSGWLSPLLMMTREKIWKTCEMSFSTCTLAQHCRILPGRVQ